MTLAAETPEGIDMNLASHLPALLACVAATSGPVLEIGVGWCSTPVLHSVCSNSDRGLVSIEADQEWRDKLAAIYAGPSHHFEAAWKLEPEHEKVWLRSPLKFQWAVALIDDSPGPDRWKHVESLLPAADYIVVHDAQGEDIMEPLRPIIANVKHQFMHKRFTPWTLVLSNTREIPHIP